VSRPRTRRRTPPARTDGAQFIVVTGLSGAGKSHALRALEDLGYFCVDNLPVALIPPFADLMLGGQAGARRAAVVVDVREGRELSRLPATYRRLKRRFEGRIRLVFLEAADAAIQRRFSETRRPHPLAAGRSVAEGIRDERRLLEPMRRLADRVLDTTALTVHELRRTIVGTTGGAERASPLAVTFVSFGFRAGIPPEADLLFDVRFLPNPHFVAALRPKTGRHKGVAAYVLESRAAARFLTLTTNLLRFLLPQYVAEGKAYLTIAVGCTGGRHRSVAIAEELARRLTGIDAVHVRVRHRDVATD
jgi:UPF0042 nucleotide-binding protein